MIRPKARRWLLALCLAEHAMEQADEMVRMVSQRTWRWSDPSEHFLYNACITGLACSYMRPFTGQNGLRDETLRFQKQFGRFQKCQHKQAHAHALLKQLRHKAYAHYDFVHWKVLETTGDAESHGVIELVINQDQGSYSITPLGLVKYLPPDELEAVHKLLICQLIRIRKTQAIIIQGLRKKHGAGRYRLIAKPKLFTGSVSRDTEK